MSSPLSPEDRPVRPVEIAPGIVLGGDALPVIAGPCVIESADAEGRLVGCLSDGDLRRLLERDDTPLDRTAGDCMTPGPRTIDDGALASSALKLMEDHHITSLFICGDEGRLEGIVHLHDLWRLELF